MTRLRPTRRPAFIWQAGLILLPVLVIATVAITAIIENRTAVERDSRRRAEEVARQYSKELERPWGSFLMRHDQYSQRWTDYLSKFVGAWPGSEQRTRLEAEAAQVPERDPRAQLAEWQAQFPGLQAEDVFPDSFGLAPAGRFHGGLELNPAPQPPAWFTGLSPAQRAAWDALKAATSSGASAEEIEQRTAQFQETGPEAEAGVNAAFIGLRARLATQLPEQAVAEALRFAEENPAALSEVGLPLANLAFGEALRYARATGPSEVLWTALPRQVMLAPSPLVPALLDQLQEVVDTNTVLQASVAAWRTLWQARLKLYDMADRVRQTGKLQGITTANFWIEENQTRWLCLLNPANGAPSSIRNGGRERAQMSSGPRCGSCPNQWPNMHWCGRWRIGGEAAGLPWHRSLSGGGPLTLPERWSPGRETNSTPLLLAEANGALSSVAKLRRLAGGPEVDAEGLPSRPRFVLQLYVADPALLFASYRRHALLLAGLVAASAFAALIGVIASRRAFQRQLRLSELKSNFVSSVSHELRAPIASVRLMAESLERGKVTEAPKQHEYFRFIVQECRRLSSLIENVLDFSRIEQGRKQYDFEPTDLLALTQQTIKLMQTYASERGVELHLQLANTISHQLPNYQLPADGKALQQALINLIDNALKHSPKGDTVTVGMEVRSSTAPNPSLATVMQLWVEDHGDGIPPSEHERIFERFYRRGSELRRQTQGVGIGLSIVKHIVEAHGGRVLVRSAVGQGSRFTIELPIPSPALKPEARDPKTE